VAFFLMLAGVTYHGVASAIERVRLPHPGRLVDVGGHQLHIHCTGDGAPTVVLEADAGMPSAAWATVQPLLAARQRTCSYDRSGLGWSETGERTFTSAAVPDTLRTLLTNAGERPPFVLVGARTGAAFAGLFAARYPGDTAGLVVVDGEITQRRIAPVTAAAPWLARIGVRRLLRQADPAAAGVPSPAGDAIRTFFYRPDHLTRAAAEFASTDDARRLARDAAPATRRVEVADDPPAIVAAVASIAGAQAGP
jgi:pimeloyl-ACP methyl ester carboxylesterase